MHHRRRKYGVSLVVLVFLAACRDKPITEVETIPVRTPPARLAGDLEPGFYWRASDTLWIYDTRPEVGVGAHQLSQLSVDQIHDLKMRMTRYTLYIDAYVSGQQPNFHNDVQNACNQGLIPVIVVHAGEVYLGSPIGNYDLFGSFMSDVVTANTCVKFWQLWNEVEAGFPGNNVFGGGSAYSQGLNYAEMLKRAYPAIKAANPSTWVVTTGLVSTDSSWSFLNGIYDGGGRQYFDIVAKHSYGTPAQWDGNPNPSCTGVTGSGHRSAAVCIRNVMQSKGDVGRILWSTEFGWGACEWPTGPNGAWGNATGAQLDATQQEFWRDVLNISDSTRYYQKVIGYQLWANDCPGFADQYEQVPSDLASTGMTYEDYGFGLVRANGTTPKPSYLYLRDQRDYNAHILGANGSATASGYVTVYAPAKKPVGYSYTRNGNNVTFYVTVDKLFPTVVTWQPDTYSASISGPSQVKPFVTCTWSASVTGGVSPYSYSWQAVSTSGSGQWFDFQNSVVNGGSFAVYLTVTDATGRQVSTSRNVLVRNTAPTCLL